jgi:hypothetical protein
VCQISVSHKHVVVGCLMPSIWTANVFTNFLIVYKLNRYSNCSKLINSLG